MAIRLKRIIKLKGELILGVCISTVAAVIIALTFNTFYREKTLTEEKLVAMATEKNNHNFDMVKKQLQVSSNNENLVYENMKRLEKIINYSDVDRIFVVDNEGNVKKSTGEIPIRQIDLTYGEGSRIIIRKSKFIATNIITLNQDCYLVYLNENYIYNDLIVYQVAAITMIVIFLIMISGRVKYISNIANDVRDIAKGDLSKRVTIKYKNELTDLAEDINYMVRELENQDLNEKEFITNISHDLRTPLTTILGYSKMIEQRVYSNEEDLQRYVSIINKKGSYLKSMMDDFFDYTKLSSKDMKLDMIVINLGELILQLLDGEELNFQKRNLNLDVKLENKIFNIHGDSMLMARALSNLINNALKYSKDNTTVNITLKEQMINETNYGVFEIDNLPKNNISEEQAENLFNRLYKVSKARNEEGSGLGLAITQEIIKAHNGSIKIKLIEGRIRLSIFMQLFL